MVPGIGEWSKWNSVNRAVRSTCLQRYARHALKIENAQIEEPIPRASVHMLINRHNEHSVWRASMKQVRERNDHKQNVTSLLSVVMNKRKKSVDLRIFI